MNTGFTSFRRSCASSLCIWDVVVTIDCLRGDGRSVERGIISE